MKTSLIRYLLLQSDYELFEAMGAITLILFGVSAFVNGKADAWSGPGYKYISLFFTPNSFAALLTIAGVAGLLALRYGSLRTRIWVVAGKTLVWAFTFLIFAIANPPRSVSPFLLAFLIMHFILIGRIWSDYSLRRLPWSQR